MTSGETTGGGMPAAPSETLAAQPGSAEGGKTPEEAKADRRGPKVALFVERYALLMAFIAMMFFFSFWHKTSHSFGASPNFQNTGGDYRAFTVVLAMALLIPLLCGEFDLSVGQIAGFSQIGAAVAMSKHGATFGESIVVAVLLGAAIGFINGNTVARVGVNSLIVTLGTSGVLLGVIQWYTQGNEVGSHIHPSVANFDQLNSIFGIPRTVLVALGVALLVWYVVNQTPYGRYLQSVGSNPRAAQLVGLPVSWLKLSAFVLSGALAGFAGIFLFASAGAGSSQSGTVLDTLQALAVVFLGATAIKPGRFNVEGTVIAIYFLAFTIQGLELAGVAPFIAAVFNGAALFIAVIVSTELRNRRTGNIGG
jgi:ribose transport system permease protein